MPIADPNEFKKVKKGLPQAEASPNKLLLFLFLLIGTSLGCCLIVAKIGMTIFGGLQVDNLFFDRQVSAIVGNFISWTIYTVLLTIIVGIIQTSLIKDKIISPAPTFILSVFIGGVVGGVTSGL